MAFPITPIIDLCNSLICAYCSYQLYRSWRREPANRQLFLFSLAYVSLVFSYLFFSIPRLIMPGSSYFLGVSFVIAQACLYVALAFFSRITTSLIKPAWSRPVFIAVLIISLVAVALSVVYFTRPHYDTTTGITEWNIQPVVGVFSTLIFIITLVPSMLLFLWQGYRSAESTVKVRSLIIGCGLLLLIITAYTYYNATTAHAALISDIISLLSYVVIFVGVVYRRNRPAISIKQ